jgi:sugar/nucleoside kinase (ribokinase family)
MSPGGSAAASPDVVVVGAASRDLTADDARGWRLGGAATYAALLLARLGLRVAAVIGVDALAAAAEELQLLRGAGVRLILQPLEHGPVFENLETPRGRVQRAMSTADALRPDPAALAELGAGAARGWLLGPVAGEVRDAWADAIPGDAAVAVGWQGLLREVLPDGRVVRRSPERLAIVRRADLVAVSRDDLSPDTALDQLTAYLGPAATLVVTHGGQGGVVIDPMGSATDGGRRLRRYPAIRSPQVVDATGAGDVFLATLFAARLDPALIEGRPGRGLDLLLAASASSLVVEAEGLAGVPTRSALRDRVRIGQGRLG